MATLPTLNEFQKASLTVIKDVSVQLILIAVGVFALSGSLLARQTQPLSWRGSLTAAFILLILSVLSGAVALGNAVAQLSQSGFNAYVPILRYAYLLQLLFMLTGGIFFVAFLLKNIP